MGKTRERIRKVFGDKQEREREDRKRERERGESRTERERGKRMN